MLIEDQELRSLFKAESEEHLQLLDEGLLRLEAEPADLAVLGELFRSAHSLKGAARMLGLEDVESVTHWFEGVLGSAKDSGISPASDAVSRMYAAVDSIRRLVAHSLTGEPSGVDVEAVLCRLAAAGSNPLQSEQPLILSAHAQPPEPWQGTDKLQTIRVELGKLDSLMTHAGELIVTKTRLARRTAQFDELVTLWEELNKSPQSEAHEKLGALLYRLRDDICEDTARLEYTVSRVDEGVRDIRLLPLSTIFSMFPRLVRDIAAEQHKEVQMVIHGGETVADKRIVEEMKDPIMHMIRNAVDHGIEPPSQREAIGKARTGTLRLSAASRGTNIIIELSDDGRGLSEASIEATAITRKIANQEQLSHMTRQEIQALIFRPGFSTCTVVNDISGRGVGMDVVRTNVEALKGTIELESSPGSGCTVRIQLPATLATSRALLIAAGGLNYVLPLEHIHSTRLLSPDDLITSRGRQSIFVDDKPIPIVGLCGLLELSVPAAAPLSASAPSKPLSCVVVSAGKEQLAIAVDELLDEQEVIIQSHGGLLKRVRNVSGSAILVTGAVSIVLNPMDLIRSAAKRAPKFALPPARLEEKSRPKILLVEDSITTRTWEKRGLESAGYEVVAAVDGVEALQKLSQHTFCAVVSDIEMPRMDGLTMTERIRRDNKYKELPVILVTSLADDADKTRGIDAGANAYITKSAFDQKLLVETVQRLT